MDLWQGFQLGESDGHGLAGYEGKLLQKSEFIFPQGILSKGFQYGTVELERALRDSVSATGKFLLISVPRI